ncbi:MAG TPA: glycosyltransferase family 2 protein [Pyrinomonadaceae bacterium]|nr:glycosyltransferase family 2 protein [Pyrinomonadaceae bacterium]
MPSGTARTASRPLVSVIVPTYNYGRLIGHSLESLRAQTYTDWECVVVDDGSTDDTAEVVARYAASDARIRYVRQENRRQAAARNNGMRHSRGDYFQFLDADDLVEPRKFERQVEYLEAHPEIDVVYGDARYFSDDEMRERHLMPNGRDEERAPTVSGSGEAVVAALVRKDPIPINTALVRRSVVERVGDFDERLSPVEDWEFWIRCAALGARFHYEVFDETYALVRCHPASASRSSGRRLLGAILLMRRKIMGMPLSAEVLRVNRELAAEEEGLLGVEEVMEGERASGAFRLCRAAVRDANARHRVKWLACACAAPFVSRERFYKLYSSSLTRSAAESLTRLAGGQHRA